MSGAPRGWYAKKWDSIFSAPRDIKEDWSRSYVDKKRDIDAAGDGIELFFQDVEGSEPDDRVEKLKKYAASVSLDDLKAASGSVEACQDSAWLDERSNSQRYITSRSRQHKNPLSAARLYKHLKTPRIGNENLPDADRRLIYIKNMDAAYMLALAETAAPHEVPFLRDALWNHHDGLTSLKVRIPTKGYKLFQLEFHLKFFVLRNPPPANEKDRGELVSNPQKWTDLSFLEMKNPNESSGRKYGMFEAQFSLVICGSHEARWVAYAFDDTEVDEEDLCDRISVCDGFHPDPILDDETDADCPIWNPREYFLRTLANRITRGTNSWDALVRAIDRSIGEYRAQHPSTLAQRQGRKMDRGETIRTFDWTRQTKELVDRLRKTLSETIKFWKDFNEVNGDADYFTDINPSDETHNRIKAFLCEINERFQTLEKLQRNLDSLSVLCKDSENALQLRLTLEGSEATKSSGATTDFATFVLLPIALATGCLQLPPSMMPMPPGPKSLAILTFVFMVTIKILHAISGAFPGIKWWWKTLISLTEAMKLEGPSFSAATWSRQVLRRRGDQHDRNTEDVEMGTVPP